MAPRKIVVFGNGSIAELADYYFKNDSPQEVVAFTVDDEHLQNTSFMGKPLVAFETVAAEYPPDEFSVFIALSYSKLNQVRQEKFEAAIAKGYSLPSYIASHLATWDNVDIGDNCFILENQTIQPFCKIGNNVTLWSGNHIGHHSTIADHTFVASHVVISGNCNIGARCFIGVNATLRDGCKVGDDSFIGMAASVTADVPEGSVVLGPSAEVLAPNDRRAKALKRSYFKI